MTRTFDIAGHLVSLCLTDGNLLGKMNNLSPFVSISKDVPLVGMMQVEELSCPEPLPILVSEEEGFPKITVGKTEGGLWFFTVAPLPHLPISCRFTALPDFSKVEFKIERTEDSVFALNNALMLVYALSTARLGTLEIHASAVVKDGRGVAFLGRSGTGKSTHSRLWLENIPQTELLNDDNPIIRIAEDNVYICGSPWSGKTPCYKQERVPLAAVVRLSQAPENKMERLPLLEAYASLYPSVSSFRPERSLADGLHKTLETLVKRVPCYHLGCLPDAAAAQLCFETVYGNQGNS